ncbi:MAG: type IV pilin N-terminal domain-containing protein [Methanoregula sp.]|nr:type IV pilin N-terminal domain-containing protein [Methanoregula sp.]
MVRVIDKQDTILLSVFSAALFNFLPDERDPSVTLLMTNDGQNVILWHKGGNWVKKEDLPLIWKTTKSSIGAY